MSTTKDKPRMIIPTVNEPCGRRRREDREQIAKQLAEGTSETVSMPSAELKPGIEREAPQCPMADQMRALSEKVRLLETGRIRQDEWGVSRSMSAQLVATGIEFISRIVLQWMEEETGG